MRTILRNLVLVPALVAAAAFATKTAQAEVTVKVPFSFTAAGKTCPAGFYSVYKDAARSMVTLRSKDATNSFTWVLIPENNDTGNSQVVLKFEADGPTHTLESVQFGHQTTFRLDRNSKTNESVPMQIGHGR
jgi:hypothetical protein